MLLENKNAVIYGGVEAMLAERARTGTFLKRFDIILRLGSGTLSVWTI
jgi:hypothetical protein